MVRAGLRRLLLLILGAAGVTAAASVVIGALFGTSYGRALTIGFYLAGCFMMLAGFFIGNRGPARMKSDTRAPSGGIGMLLGGRDLRWATLSEQDETINNSAVYIVLGLVLVAIGILFDSRHSLL
jgi:divalent metal cation (Fe/Co/Zn/Cd) transporter